MPLLSAPASPEIGTGIGFRMGMLSRMEEVARLELSAI